MSLAIRAAQPLVSTAEFKLRPRPSMKKMKVKVTQSCPTLLQHHGLYSPWNSPGQNARVGSLSFLQGIFWTQGLNLVLQADSLPAEPPGKPKNTGVDSLSLLQGIFPTQESNQGLLHCRRSLYQLSYQENPWSVLKELASSQLSAPMTLSNLGSQYWCVEWTSK